MKKLCLISLVTALVSGLGLVSCGGPDESTPPSAPAGLTCNAVSSSQIDLSWSAPSGAITGYNVYRCTGTTCTPTDLVSTGSGTPWSDTGLTPNTAYRYRVTAYNEAGESGYSAIVDCTTGIEINFNQVDFFFNGSLVQANSDWGEFTVEFIPGDDVEFINVLANAGGPNEWIVRNVPLIPSSLDPSEFAFSTYFDLGQLGVTSGTDISSLNYCFTQSTLPSSSAPDCIPHQLAFVGNSSAITNSGVPSGVTAVGPPPAADVFDFLDPFIGVEICWHEGMPNCVQGHNQCGPGAATNSLHWLAKENGWALKNADIQQTLGDLVSAMGTDNVGTWDGPWDGHAGFASGKLKFAKDKSLPLTNHYTGGEELPKTGDFVDPRGNGRAVRDGDATWAWVEKELDKGQDVEVMTATHWVVLEGKISWGNVHLVSYRDDNLQHGAATTDDEKAALAKRHTCTYMREEGGNLHTNIGNGDEIVLTVFSESSAPAAPLPPFTQPFVICQSANVSAWGNVTFTYNGTVIGGPYWVHCPFTYGYRSAYGFDLPQEPNDISWAIYIRWAPGDESVYLWHGENQPWPATYETTHSPSFVRFGVPSEYYLTVGASEGGTVTVSPPPPYAPNAVVYAPGTVVTLTATPIPGHAFLNWTGDVARMADVNSAHTTITMYGDYNVTANFE